MRRNQWWERLKRLFTQPVKIPGWLLVLWVASQEIPDWKSRIDFWVGVAADAGGYLAVPAAAIASPYFTPTLLVAGLAWILLAGEPAKGVQRHHWLRYVGWSIFTLCFTAFVITVGWGAIEFYIQQQVSNRDQEIQHNAAVRPVYWHLTDAQKTALKLELDDAPVSERFHIQIECLPDAGSRTYVEDLGQVFEEAKWKIDGNCLFSSVKPDLTGLYVAVSPSFAPKEDAAGVLPMDELPKNAKKLMDFLQEAQIPARWGVYKNSEPPQQKDDDFFLIIGNAP